MKKKITIWLEEEQIKKLDDHYKKTGSKRSESIRRSVDLFLKQQEKKNGNDKV